MATDKDTRALLRSLQRAGFLIERTRGDHLRVTHPDATGAVFHSSTSSDHRAILNFKRDLRRVFGERAQCLTRNRQST